MHKYTGEFFSYQGKKISCNSTNELGFGDHKYTVIMSTSFLSMFRQNKQITCVWTNGAFLISPGIMLSVFHILKAVCFNSFDTEHGLPLLNFRLWTTGVEEFCLIYLFPSLCLTQFLTYRRGSHTDFFNWYLNVSLLLLSTTVQLKFPRMWHLTCKNFQIIR